jgi:hypothetical protein
MIDRGTRRGGKSQTERAGRTLTAHPALSVFSELSNNAGITLLSRLLSPRNTPACYYLHLFHGYFIKPITALKNSPDKTSGGISVFPPAHLLFI